MSFFLLIVLNFWFEPSSFAEEAVDNSAFQPVTGGADLNGSYFWQGLEGARVDGRRLCVDSIGRWIIGLPIDSKSKESNATPDWYTGQAHRPDTLNPPIDYLGPQINDQGDIEIAATLESKSSKRAFLEFYSRVPEIQDETRREGRGLSVGIEKGSVVVKVWSGSSSAPDIHFFAHNKGNSSRKARVTLRAQKQSLMVFVDGQEAGRIPDPGVFPHGPVYIGADVAAGNQMCVSGFSVSEPVAEKGRSSVIVPSVIAELPASSGLRELADRRGINLGTCVSINALMTDSEYRATLARNFNMVTPENAMKFQFIHPEPGRYAFKDADAIVQFASVNHIKVHAHTLSWGEAVPRWVTDGHYTNTQLRQILHDHIATVAGHFRGQVAEWDVLNEPLEDDGTLRKTIWFNAIGDEYPAIVFQWAHEADPDAKLFINEYGADGLTDSNAVNPRVAGLFALVQKIRQAGAPVHGVGLQMHDELGDYVTTENAQAAMQKFKDLGVEVRISEMDVNVDDPTPANLGAQAQIFSWALKACLASSNCRTFSMWGFEDRYSSLQKSRSMYASGEGWGHGMIMDINGLPKPAYEALRATLSQ